MSKRLTDTDKYKKPFIRGLQGAYKLLWDYLYHDCNHAGIWIVDFEVAQIYLGQDMPVNKKDALKYFNIGEMRILEFAEGKKWLILPFISFQYGTLNKDNRVHRSVISALEGSNLPKKVKGLIRGLQGCKDKDKDKAKDKDKDTDLNVHFEFFWDTYQKKVKTDKCRDYWRGNKKLANGKRIGDADRELIIKILPEYIKSTPDKKYRKDPSTYLYNSSWLDEIIQDKGDHLSADPFENLPT